jgi:hypothetical protein
LTLKINITATLLYRYDSKERCGAALFWWSAEKHDAAPIALADIQPDFQKFHKPQQ